MAADFSTPQAALLSLEAAYDAKDIEGAVAAKNFRYEARAMLINLKSIKNPDAELVQKTAEVLELSFRKHMKEKGFPNMSDRRTKILEVKHLAPDLAELTEETTFSDGFVMKETVHAAKSGDRWGVVILPGK